MDSENGSTEIGSTKGGEGGPPASGRLDADQTLADTDQTLADSDQSSSDRDQTAAESDQVAADSDQAASDRDLAHGADPGEHAVTKELRDQGAEQRRHTAHARAETAEARDAVAAARDLAATARDEAAALHDRELAARDAAWSRGRLAGILARTTKNRKRAAADRSVAAEGRARAARDREQASRDRAQAARDRLEGQADREALLSQLAIAETDALTGARTRAAGLTDVDHEIDRARRTTGLLAVAYVDVVGLKVANDSRGHAAGDALLQRVVGAIRARLRPYDLIVRLGGDEFLCVMSDTTTEEARQRLGEVEAALAADADPAQIKVGFAALAPDEGAAELIERADHDMPASHTPRAP